MIKKEEVVKIGRFTKPHGIKGEIGLITRYDVFDDESNDPYVVCEIDGILVPFFIESYRYKTNTITLVKLENIDSEEYVREFTNLDVYYPISRMGGDSNSAEQITRDELIGYTVTDQNTGLLGIITNVDESTINVVLEINYNGRELLIPAAGELIASIDHIKKQLTVNIPKGLLDL